MEAAPVALIYYQRPFFQVLWYRGHIGASSWHFSHFIWLFRGCDLPPRKVMTHMVTDSSQTKFWAIVGCPFLHPFRFQFLLGIFSIHVSLIHNVRLQSCLRLTDTWWGHYNLHVRSVAPLLVLQRSWSLLKYSNDDFSLFQIDKRRFW